MRIDKVYTDFVAFKSIWECRIEKRVNAFGSAYIKGIVSGRIDLSRKISEITWMSVYGESIEGEKENLFTGIIQSIDINVENDLSICEINLTSGVKLLDKMRKTCTFQDRSETYRSIIEKVNNSYEIIYIDDMSIDKPVEHIYVQYKETDWEFLKRLAADCHTYLIPAHRQKKIAYCVGMNLRDELFEEKLTEYKIQNIHGIIIASFQHRELLDIGNKVQLNGDIYHVYAVTSILQNSEIVNYYELRKLENFVEKDYRNDLIVGASLDAVVIDVKADKVKIQVSCDIQQYIEKAFWYPYSSVFSSPDGTGWYCMPEINDQVRLYFPNEKEEEAYVISSVHISGAEGQRENPDNKSFMNKYHKQIELTPTMISMRNNQGMSIVLDDNEGIKIESSKNITFTAQEECCIISALQDVSLVANETIDLEQNGSLIKLDGDITMTGGQIKVQN